MADITKAEAKKGVVVYAASGLASLAVIVILGKALWEGRKTQDIKMSSGQVWLTVGLLAVSFGLPVITGANKDIAASTSANPSS